MDINFELVVGFLEQNIIDILGVDLKPGVIKLLPGGIKHIRKKRLTYFEDYINKVPEIIKTPDYVGTNPKYANSVEYVKKYTDNILVAVRLECFTTLCVVTLYDITDSKIATMIEHGRIIEFTDGDS